jgi:hypothetical protein
MFSSFRRLLKRSKDREIPQANENDSYAEGNVNNKNVAYIAIALLNRPRPGLAAEISRLCLQHRDLQRRFKQLPPGKPHIRRAKVIDALKKMGSRSAVQPGRNLGRPLTSIDPSWLAARSAQRIKATKIPSYRNGSLVFVTHVQKSASLEAETSLDAWHTKKAALSTAAPSRLPPVEIDDEKGVAAPFKQASSAHRMRRLREWSLTHGAVEGGGRGEQDFAETALAEIQQQGTTNEVTTPIKDTNSSSTRGAASLKDKAWSIMAGLSLETADKKRGAAAVEINAASKPEAAKLRASEMSSDTGDRRKTEPLSVCQPVGRKPSRSPSDGERQKETQRSDRWRRSSLVGRPRTNLELK